MNNSIFQNLFQKNNNIDNLMSNFIIDKKKEESFNENRINYKLTLRKQKLQQTIFNKRETKSIKDFQVFNFEDIKKNKFKEEEILSGKYYDILENAYKANNNFNIRNLLNDFCYFFSEKGINEDLLSKIDSSYNIKNNIKKKKIFPLASLLLEIGINTNDKMVYTQCFNLILNISYISDIFCLELSDEKVLNKIMEKLVLFYPYLTENKKLNEQYKHFRINKDLKKEDIFSYYIGNQILQLLGNIFISSNLYTAFESINFYEKTFYLLFVFDLDIDHQAYINFRYIYLETLIWLINLFITKINNFFKNYSEKLLIVLPCLLNNIKGLYYTKENFLLEEISELINNISDLNNNFSQQLVESDAINILTNLFKYLFKDEKNKKSEEIILNNDNISDILSIYINIFILDSKYLKNLDFSYFAKVIEKLIDIHKVKNSDNYYIRKKIIYLLGNLANFNDIEQIVQKFMINEKIKNNVLNYYYEFHKKETLIFIENVINNQSKTVIELLLDLGGFEIIKKNILNYEGNSKEVISSSIEILFKMIEFEKKFNIKLLYEKIFNTSIPQKIIELLYEKDFQPKIKTTINLIAHDFEEYEKSTEMNNKF